MKKLELVVTNVKHAVVNKKTAAGAALIGALLRNRCAYLIGVTQTQRDEILRDFQEIYDVRSKIVHGGKKRLDNNEKLLLDKLQWMCRRVISREVELLCNEDDVA
ncbi:hypothetical protein HJ187_17680 [Vibrio parahaemolyticus]|nr:hypothetical protein [Vibrio parahaemolyticus]